jgi:hypothetical protein
MDELQSVASTSKFVSNKLQKLKSSHDNLPPQFENNPKENTIPFYIPRKLSESSQRLILRATISCGWSFNWVYNPEATTMLNFANKGLSLIKEPSELWQICFLLVLMYQISYFIFCL